jgi:xanthine dehydrogenase accessory factor
VRDVLGTLERWGADGLRAALATVVRVDRSAPRQPGSVMAISERGEVAGSVTGGCVEPAVYEEAEAVLSGEPARLLTYGIADEYAFGVGLPCGGTVQIYVEPLEHELVAAVAAALRAERPLAYVTTIGGPGAGVRGVLGGDPGEPEPPWADARAELVERARAMLAHGETGLFRVGDDEVFVSSFVARPNMYVFGAVDHAAAVATVGRFLGYRVTVCDARATFVTPERFPDVDELVVEWPHEFIARSPVDERTVVCVLTHDHKFDIPLLKATLDTPALYIGAMGARRTTEQREARLREQGVSDEALARIHAPIGLPIGSRTPEEVAIAIAAEIIAVTRRGSDAVAREALARV